jgi:hypothetical protein
MANTYTLLETITVGAAGASSVTFNSIPQTGYSDLVIKASIRTLYAGASEFVSVYPNGSGSNGTRRALFGTGSAAGSENAANIRFDYFSGNTTTANTFGSGEIYIPNYTSSNFKSFSMEGVAETNATAVAMAMTAGLWSSTAAITSLQFVPGNGNFMQFTTFSLYGVSALGTTPTKAPKATGGSIIQTDGTYWYHAFLSSGTFTPATALTCDVLVVAGGGGGGGNKGAGGGAGGVSYLTSSSISTAKTVTIGGGGTAGAGVGGSGTNSVFDSITSNGGGGGGSDSSRNGITGGSGGGASRDGSIGSSNQGSTGGATGYGFAGGLGLNVTYFGGGGGGGAGAVGANMVSSAGGAGGAGLNTWSSWLSTTGLGVSGYIAGGGGGGIYSGSGTQSGGVGGSGGGGNGGNNVNGTQTVAPVIGTANTGSGGGGAGDTPATGAAGGSGLVIIRYLA